LAWSNDDLTLFHGCTDQSLLAQTPTGIAVGVKDHGISPFVGSRNPDFGPGFYTTTWLDQAKSWANVRLKVVAKRSPNARAIVLRIEMKRNDLADLEALVFTNERDSYWPFVRYCRRGGSPHARVGSKQRAYDVVYGPVSLGWQEFVVKDSDQVSFHTQRSVARIPIVAIEVTGSPSI
jgi:Protein of unknown function (DUF3990)